MTKRFEYMMSGKKRKNWRVPYVVVMVALYILSYVIIFEVSYVDPKMLEEEGAFILTEENAYIIKNMDGTYDVYYNNEYFYTVSELEYDLNKLPIVEKRMIQ